MTMCVLTHMEKSSDMYIDMHVPLLTLQRHRIFELGATDICPIHAAIFLNSTNLFVFMLIPYFICQNTLSSFFVSFDCANYSLVT